MIYEYQPRSYIKRQRRNRLLRLIGSGFILTVLFACLYFLTTYLFDLRAKAPSLETVVSPLAQQLEPEKQIVSGLSTIFAKQNREGTYAVAIKHLRTGEEYYYNENRIFDAASLYKLWVMATTYDQLEDGMLKKETVLSEKAETLNEKFDIASESAEISEGEITFSIDQALNRMITISHNYAALLLSSRVRLSNVTSLLKEYNLNKSTLNPPRTTASDILSFFELLYNGKIVNQDASLEMIELLKKQQLNDRLPKYLPDEIEIAHKTGELGKVKHDAGIVFSDKGDYIIVIMTETDNSQNAAEISAKISESVYEYFSKSS